MRINIAPATIMAIWACSAAQAQNVPKSCDIECLQQRVSALEQVMEDRLTTGTVGLPGPDVYSETFIPNPPTLTPYISALSCQRHLQTVTVPSEAGGTIQINVRRC
jgi:hypothetical protein